MSAADEWSAITRLAADLSARGMMVGQLHTTAAPHDTPAEWSYGDHGTHLFHNAAYAAVVTCDGRVWPLEGAQSLGDLT